MQDRPVKVPGPDHPITIARTPGRVVVTVAGNVLADTRAALSLREASHPAVYYIPRADVDMTRLERSSHRTYCPYKGDCGYFTVRDGGPRGVNAAWSYEAPFAAVAEIRDHIAFYRDRVDSIVVMPQP